MLKQKPVKFPGGEVRITDTSNFPISKTTAAAHVTINPHGLREMHWHPNADEWSFIIRGKARVTIFASNGNARTFNYQAGDVGIVPKNNAHFVENIGDEPVEMLEAFRASKFEDFSVEQWLAQTPATMVAEHMNLTGLEGRVLEVVVQGEDGGQAAVKEEQVALGSQDFGRLRGSVLVGETTDSGQSKGTSGKSCGIRIYQTEEVWSNL